MSDDIRTPETAPSPSGGVTAFLAVSLGVLAVSAAAGAIGDPGAGDGTLLGAVGAAVGVILGGALSWLAIRWWSDGDTLLARMAESVGEDEDARQNSGWSRNRERPQNTEITVVEQSVRTVTAANVLLGLVFGSAVALVTVSVGYTLSHWSGPLVPTVTILGAMAILAVVLDGTVGIDTAYDGTNRGDTGAQTETSGVLGTANGSTLDSATAGLLGVTILGIVVGIFATLGTFGGALAGQWVLASPPLSPFALVVVLQILVVLLALTLPYVTEALEDILGPERYEPPAIAAWLERSPHEIPERYWQALAAQLGILLLFGDALSWYGLSSLLGGGRTLALVAGKLLPLGLVAVLLLAGLVVLGWFGHLLVLAATGEHGPLVVRSVAAVVPVIVAVAGLLWTLPPLYETAVTLPLGVGAAAVGYRFFVFLLAAVAGSKPFPDQAAGFALAAVLLAGLAVITAFAGGAPLAVYVAVATALLVWYAGSFAAEVGGHLGRAADTATAEGIHAVTLAGVVGTALTLVSVVTYLVGIPRGLFGGSRAVTAAVFLLVAALAVIGRQALVSEEASAEQ
jgi:hypothetical protein